MSIGRILTVLIALSLLARGAQSLQRAWNDDEDTRVLAPADPPHSPPARVVHAVDPGPPALSQVSFPAEQADVAVGLMIKIVEDTTAWNRAVLTRGQVFKDLTREELAQRVLDDVNAALDQEGADFTRAELVLAGGMYQQALRLNHEGWDPEWNIPLTLVATSLHVPENDEEDIRDVVLEIFSGEREISLAEIARRGGVLATDIEYVQKLTLPNGLGWDPPPTPFEERMVNLLSVADAQEWRGLVNEEFMIPLRDQAK